MGSSAYRSISHINSCVCCFIGFIGAHFSDILLLVKPPWRQLDSAAAPTSLDVTAVHLSCVSLASALLIQWMNTSQPIQWLLRWPRQRWLRCVCGTSVQMKNFFLFFVIPPLIIRRGVQSTVETAPNEAIHLCWKQSLINSVYLQNFFVWQGAKPRTPTTSSCLHGRRNLNVFWMLFHSWSTMMTSYSIAILGLLSWYCLSSRSTFYWPTNSSRIVVFMINLHVTGLSSWWIS